MSISSKWLILLLVIAPVHGQIWKTLKQKAQEKIQQGVPQKAPPQQQQSSPAGSSSGAPAPTASNEVSNQDIYGYCFEFASQQNNIFRDTDIFVSRLPAEQWPIKYSSELLDHVRAMEHRGGMASCETASSALEARKKMIVRIGVNQKPQHLDWIPDGARPAPAETQTADVKIDWYMKCYVGLGDLSGSVPIYKSDIFPVDRHEAPTSREQSDKLGTAFAEAYFPEFEHYVRDRYAKPAPKYRVLKGTCLSAENPDELKNNNFDFSGEANYIPTGWKGEMKSLASVLAPMEAAEAQKAKSATDLKVIADHKQHMTQFCSYPRTESTDPPKCEAEIAWLSLRVPDEIQFKGSSMVIYRSGPQEIAKVKADLQAGLQKHPTSENLKRELQRYDIMTNPAYSDIMKSQPN